MKNDDNFIMLPTVDFCFKELMQDDRVRQGFIAALPDVTPEEVTETTLLPTILEGEFPEGKQSILDVRVSLCDRSWSFRSCRKRFRSAAASMIG